VDLFNADGLPGEDLAKNDFVVAQADAATAGATMVCRGRDKSMSGNPV